MAGSAAAGGPLGWLYPFEIQPLETRPAGGAVASLMNLLFSFVIGQPMLSLCRFFLYVLPCISWTLPMQGVPQSRLKSTS